MKRRQFISLLGGAAAAWPLAVRAQQSPNKIPVVGVLWHAGSAEEDVYLSVLVKAFHDLGYVEGKNIVLEHRFPAEKPERFRILARELVDAKPDVIIAVTTLGAVELKRATSTIPTVVIYGARSEASFDEMVSLRPMRPETSSLRGGSLVAVHGTPTCVVASLPPAGAFRGAPCVSQHQGSTLR
jgi:ABC-type uncharacterized transport system substrate-binding protein